MLEEAWKECQSHTALREIVCARSTIKRMREVINDDPVQVIEKTIIRNTIPKIRIIEKVVEKPIEKMVIKPLTRRELDLLNDVRNALKEVSAYRTFRHDLYDFIQKQEKILDKSFK